MWFDLLGWNESQVVGEGRALEQVAISIKDITSGGVGTIQVTIAIDVFGDNTSTRSTECVNGTVTIIDTAAWCNKKTARKQKHQTDTKQRNQDETSHENGLPNRPGRAPGRVMSWVAGNLCEVYHKERVMASGI
jgi:hypothetical protein